MRYLFVSWVRTILKPWTLVSDFAYIGNLGPNLRNPCNYNPSSPPSRKTRHFSGYLNVRIFSTCSLENLDLAEKNGKPAVVFDPPKSTCQYYQICEPFDTWISRAKQAFPKYLFQAPPYNVPNIGILHPKKIGFFCKSRQLLDDPRPSCQLFVLPARCPRRRLRYPGKKRCQVEIRWTIEITNSTWTKPTGENWIKYVQYI